MKRLNLLLSLTVVLPFSAPHVRAGDGGRWEPLAAMNLDRQETAAARIGNEVYVCGGLRAGFNATDTCEVYDILADTWTIIPPMPSPRDHAAAASLDGLLYILGGFDGDFLGKEDVFIFDPNTSQWTTGPSMPGPTGAAWAAEHQGKIYVFGGSFFTELNSTFIFEPGVGWSTGAPMPTAREHLNAVSVGDFIYVLGGRDGVGLNVNERYDPATNTWATMNPMPTARSAMAAAEFEGRIVCAGGEIPQLFAINEIYNPATNQWTCQSDMVLARHGVAAVTLDDRILVPAGGTIQGLAPTTVVDSFIPGPTFENIGPCPGLQSIQCSGATTNGFLLVFVAGGVGNLTLNGLGCGSIPLGLDNTTQFLLLLKADANGGFAVDLNVDAGLCGAVHMQLVDVARCTTSNVMSL